MTRALHRLHFYAASAVAGIALTVACLGGLAVMPVIGARRAVLSAGRVFARATLLALGWRLDVTGRERLRSLPSAVVAVRHQSAVDVALCAALIPRRSIGIGKRELRKVPFLGWLWAASGNVLVDRSDLPSAIASMREAAERVKRDGLLLWVAPEGTRCPGRHLGPFKKGPFHLALAGPFPVVPVAVEPLDTVFDGDRRLARPGRVRIEFLEAVVPLPDDDVASLAGRVRDAMAAAEERLCGTARPPIG